MLAQSFPSPTGCHRPCAWIATIRSLQEKHGSIPARIIGISASLWPTAVAITDAQLQMLGVRTFTRSGLSVPLLFMIVEQFAARRFHPADGFACRDAARDLDCQVAGGQVIQDCADHPVALEQLVDPHDEPRFQVAGFSRPLPGPGNQYRPRKAHSTRISRSTPEARAVGPTAPSRSACSVVIVPTPRVRPRKVSSVVTTLR